MTTIQQKPDKMKHQITIQLEETVKGPKFNVWLDQKLVSKHSFMTEAFLAAAIVLQNALQHPVLKHEWPKIVETCLEES